jgi:hypothetical protein
MPTVGLSDIDNKKTARVERTDYLEGIEEAFCFNQTTQSSLL